MHLIRCHAQARAQGAPRQARARRAQVLVRGCTVKTPESIDNTLQFQTSPFHAAMTGARPARASSGARQAREGSSSQLYWKDADYYWQYNAFHTLPCTGARPGRASSGARQARAGSSSRLYWKDADYYWQYNAFHMMPCTGPRPGRASTWRAPVLQLYCKDAGYYGQNNAFHMMPFHDAMRGARQARAASSSRFQRSGKNAMSYYV